MEMFSAPDSRVVSLEISGHDTAKHIVWPFAHHTANFKTTPKFGQTMKPKNYRALASVTTFMARYGKGMSILPSGSDLLCRFSQDKYELNSKRKDGPSGKTELVPHL